VPIDLTYERVRFASALFTTVSGVVLAVGAFTFTGQTVRWIGLGAGCGTLAVLAIAFAVRGRGAAQRVLDLPLAVICGWTIVASRVIEHSGGGSSPHAVKWLSLSAGAAICGFGAVALFLHERGVTRDLQWAAQRIQTLQSEHDRERLSV
jgi:hypothetical protein